jgi:hypothetical protein
MRAAIISACQKLSEILLSAGRYERDKIFSIFNDYRSLLLIEAEFYAELNSALRFSIYRAPKFLRKDKCFLKIPLDDEVNCWDIEGRISSAGFRLKEGN